MGLVFSRERALCKQTARRAEAPRTKGQVFTSDTWGGRCPAPVPGVSVLGGGFRPSWSCLESV